MGAEPQGAVPATFQARVLALVARIPPGRVMTYGQLALLAGAGGAGAGFTFPQDLGGQTAEFQFFKNL